MSSKSYQRLKAEEALAVVQKKNPQTIPVPVPRPHTEFTDQVAWRKLYKEEQ